MVLETRSAKNIVISAICIVLVAVVLASCNKTALSEETTTTAVSTSVQTTAEPTVVTTTEPTTVGFDFVNLPDEHGERRTPNVTYFVPYSKKGSSSYFDDAVFIGDSVSMSLMYYNMSTSCFGKATFLTSGSLSAGNALWSLDNPKSVHPTFQGQKLYLSDAVAMSGKKKVYLMLGVNELGYTGAQGGIDSLLKLVDTILAKTPDAMFYMQSVTPLSYDRGSLNMEVVNEYNALLSELCRQRGWYFIDVASVFKNEKGYLIPEYCSDLNDMGIHFNNDACKIWADYLLTHIPTKPAVPLVSYQPAQSQPSETQPQQTQYVQIVPVEIYTIVVEVPESAEKNTTESAAKPQTKPHTESQSKPVTTIPNAVFDE